MLYAWNPWHGCKKISLGCKNCWVYFLNSKRGVTNGEIVKSKSKFNYPIQKDKNGQYKIPSGIRLATCFTSDFFIEEADAWRDEAWNVIRQRPDIEFLIPTKRIDRFLECIPDDWFDGFPNVFITVSVENQEMADKRIPVLLSLPILKKGIFLAPLLEQVDISSYLKSGNIDYVSVGGESYENARECHFEWVEQIYNVCKKYQVRFDFHQTGSNFVYQGIHYHIPHFKEYEQAKKAYAVLSGQGGADFEKKNT